MKDKPFLVLAGLFFILFVGMLTMYVLPSGSTIRAKSAAVSPLKSFAIIFPQVTTIGSSVKVTVTVRDVNGSVLPNRAIQLSGDTGVLSITPSATQSTNENGQAEFFVSSSTAGQIHLKATELAGNVSIVNIPSVEFTQ